MRRALLAVVTAAGLAIGTVMPTSALGLTQVTLNCDDGTTWTAVVDTDTLTGLVAAVQAMLDYPAGLTCTLIQVPVVTVGAVALAGSGNDPFIVGGGRWQVPSPCESPPHPLDLGEVAKVPGALSYEPIIWSPTHATTTALIFEHRGERSPSERRYLLRHPERDHPQPEHRHVHRQGESLHVKANLSLHCWGCKHAERCSGNLSCHSNLGRHLHGSGPGREHPLLVPGQRQPAAGDRHVAGPTLA